MSSHRITPQAGRALVDEVPEVTIWFRVTEILATTVGETAPDHLDDTLGPGSQTRADGGLGLGTTVTSLVFLATTLAVVSYLALTERDQLPPVEVDATR